MEYEIIFEISQLFLALMPIKMEGMKPWFLREISKIPKRDRRVLRFGQIVSVYNSHCIECLRVMREVGKPLICHFNYKYFRFFFWGGGGEERLEGIIGISNFVICNIYS